LKTTRRAGCKLWLLAAIAAFAAAACRARALAEEGIQRMEQGKQTSALERFDRALRSNASEPLALYGKGMLLADEPITQEIAVSMLRQATQQSTLPEKYRVLAYLRLAEIFAERKEKEEALQNLARITAAPQLADGQNVRRQAEIYLKLNEKERAREVLTAYLEGHGSDESTEYFLLKLYVVTMKDLKAAGKLCQQVNWQKTQNLKYLMNCARVRAALNDYTGALALTELYSRRSGQPVSKEVSELREAIGRKRGKFEPAEADF
jgi:predicted negative regulator of RcsB-dependent stress response